MSRARAPRRDAPSAEAGPTLRGLTDRLRAAAPELRQRIETDLVPVFQ
jgi:hypothetical protein